ncbi:hypothetical protein KIN20_020601 [Parelaphostrongylus tenuis]|uniref:MSP domain-containing protein n=1 Tax=Parelaphostrongylus tenuis TaxID=148309 RepID=A0AAD5N4B3_PARTN|nr:hypothetical protein KIN20_020601 [Parelaphostrongylus tenuis]
MAEMTITNESDKTVIFKMKSTKPGMFKMRPVYGAVGPNDKHLYSKIPTLRTMYDQKS